MGRVNAVDKHPKRDEIIEHLLFDTMNMKDISTTYDIKYDALTWYKRAYLKDQVKDIQKSFREEASEELRVLFYKHLDIINALLAQATDEIKNNKIQARTVNDIVKLVDLATRITGEQVYRVEMKQTWGDKTERSPRFTKGKIYSAIDLEEMR